MTLLKAEHFMTVFPSSVQFLNSVYLMVVIFFSTKLIFILWLSGTKVLSKCWTPSSCNNVENWKPTMNWIIIWNKLKSSTWRLLSVETIWLLLMEFISEQGNEEGESPLIKCSSVSILIHCISLVLCPCDKWIERHPSHWLVEAKWKVLHHRLTPSPVKFLLPWQLRELPKYSSRLCLVDKNFWAQIVCVCLSSHKSMQHFHCSHHFKCTHFIQRCIRSSLIQSGPHHSYSKHLQTF